MADKARQYLNTLQTGYRIEEYSIVTTGVPGNVVLTPFNGSRVYFYVNSSGGIVPPIYARMQSGLLVPLMRNSLDNCVVLSVANDYLSPSFEMVYENSSIGVVVLGYGIVKI